MDYKAFYDMVKEEQKSLIDHGVKTPADYKALAALYELQDYLSGHIAEIDHERDVQRLLVKSPPSMQSEQRRTHTEVIKAVMRDTNTRQVDLVKRIGVKRQSVISERINQTNISVKVMLELLNAMGYEILVRESHEEHRPGEYPIRLSDYQD